MRGTNIHSDNHLIRAQLLAIWKYFFSRLLNADESRVTSHENECSETFLNTESVPLPITFEVDEANHRMKKNKNAGFI